MALMIIGFIVIVSLIMYFLYHNFPKTDRFFHLLAFLSVLSIASITGSKVYTIILNQTVFTTEIHGIFLNPFFLIAGSYLAVYIEYVLLKFIFSK